MSLPRCAVCNGPVLNDAALGLDGHGVALVAVCLWCGREPAPAPEPDPWVVPASTTVRGRGRPQGSGDRGPRDGEDGHTARFGLEELAELRAARAAGASLLTLAVRFHVCQRTVIRALSSEYVPRGDAAKGA